MKKIKNEIKKFEELEMQHASFPLDRYLSETTLETQDRFKNLLNRKPHIEREDTPVIELEAGLLKSRYQTESYNEVANATIHEQDIWSNRGSLNSPHDHISEIGLFDETTEQVEIPELKVKTLKTTYAEILDKVKDTFSDNQESKIAQEELVASTSKVTEEVKPSGFSDLFKQIKSVKKEYGTPIMETKEELLKQVESHVNSPKVETPSIVVDKEESFPGILESVKGLNRQNTGGKESLFNVGLSPRLEKSPSLHRAPSISNLFDDTQNLFVDDDDSTNTPFNVELANKNDTKIKVDQAGGLFSVDFGDKLKDVQKLHITLNAGKIHILENNLENNKDFIFKWGDSDKNLDILNIDMLDKK
jgi:hypothetical protein